MICIDNLTIAYDAHPVVHHLSIDIATGALVAVIGPNGAGKSSLLGALAGLCPISEGSISGIDYKHCAYLPQQKQLDNHFPITVLELVKTGLFASIGLFARLQSKHQQQVQAAILRVGLSGFEKRHIHTLSGGQLQRALFARIIIQDKPIILLDEPFNAIDQKSVRALLGILQDWHQQKRTILVATHDIDQVRRYFPTTLYLARELLAYGTTLATLSSQNMQKAKNLSEAFDEDASVCYQDNRTNTE